jgi:hypothetical protein
MSGIATEETMLGQSMRSVLLALILCLLAAAVFAQNKKEDRPKTAQSIAELRQQLEKILQDTRTPGVAYRRRVRKATGEDTEREIPFLKG